jgi:hypothetical protein
MLACHALYLNARVWLHCCCLIALCALVGSAPSAKQSIKHGPKWAKRQSVIEALTEVSQVPSANPSFKPTEVSQVPSANPSFKPTEMSQVPSANPSFKHWPKWAKRQAPIRHSSTDRSEPSAKRQSVIQAELLLRPKWAKCQVPSRRSSTDRSEPSTKCQAVVQALTEVSQVPSAKPSVKHWLSQAASTKCQAVHEYES